MYKNEVQHSAQKVPVEVFLQLFDLYRSQLMISQSKIKSTKEWSAGISSGDESCESGTILLKERPRRGNIDCKDFNSMCPFLCLSSSHHYWLNLKIVISKRGP